MPARTVRRLVLVSTERRERVQRVVDFMNRAVGRGWARRMEKVDQFMDQDYPTMWLSGRKLVSRRNLHRLEEYARRFSFVPVPVTPAAPSISLRHALDAYSNRAL